MLGVVFFIQSTLVFFLTKHFWQNLLNLSERYYSFALFSKSDSACDHFLQKMGLKIASLANLG